MVDFDILGDWRPEMISNKDCVFPIQQFLQFMRVTGTAKRLTKDQLCMLTSELQV